MTVGTELYQFFTFYNIVMTPLGRRWDISVLIDGLLKTRSTSFGTDYFMFDTVKLTAYFSIILHTNLYRYFVRYMFYIFDDNSVRLFFTISYVIWCFVNL